MFRIARDRKKWEYIRNAEEYAPLRKILFDEYEKYCKNQDIAVITFSDEMIFFETGNRTIFEEKLFIRRKQLTIYTILSLLYPKEKEYIKKLEDIIWAICDEYSWQLPAHRPYTKINKRDGIDLVAAETGFYLAEIKYILGDRLNSFVVERITDEIKFRIIDSFKRESFGFERHKSNWAAVCGGCVGATLIYEDTNAFYELCGRIERCMINYFDGLSDDGSCSEGLAYWNYGFSYYIIYAELLRNYTRGMWDDFKKEKVEKVSRFANSVFLDRINIVNFSDCVSDETITIGTMYFLNKEFGIELPSMDIATLRIEKLPLTLRSFLYYDASVEQTNEPKKTYFDKLGWYIDKRERSGFAIKGGHNAEEHNHNDIGSFILTHNEKVIFAELGAPEYTADYFGSKKNNFNSSSLGHSVPIIDGEQQEEGQEYYGIISVGEDEVTVDMTKAYPNQDKKFIRCCRFFDNEFTLLDTFDADTTITERFILLSKPDISKNGIVELCGLTMKYSDNFAVKCTEVDNIMHDGVTHRTVYVLDFETNEEADRFELKVKLEG